MDSPPDEQRKPDPSREDALESGGLESVGTIREDEFAAALRREDVQEALERARAIRDNAPD